MVNKVETELLVKLPALVSVGVLEQADDAADALDQVAKLVLAEWRFSTGTVPLEHRLCRGKLRLGGPRPGDVEVRVHALFDGVQVTFELGLRLLRYSARRGETSTGLLPADPCQRWRCFYVDEVGSVAAAKAGSPWATAENYNSSRPFPSVDEVTVAVPSADEDLAAPVR